MKPKFATKVSLITVCKRWVVSTWSTVLPPSALRKRNGAYAYCKKQNVIKLTFLYSLDMIRSGWFWWYLWATMALKISQKFQTASLDITKLKSLATFIWTTIPRCSNRKTTKPLLLEGSFAGPPPVSMRLVSLVYSTYTAWRTREKCARWVRTFTGFDSVRRTWKTCPMWAKTTGFDSV